MNPQNINKLKTELAAKEAKYGELCKKVRNPVFDEDVQKLAEEIVALKTEIRDNHIENFTRRASPEEFCGLNAPHKGPPTDDESHAVLDAASEELRQNPDAFKKEPRP